MAKSVSWKGFERAVAKAVGGLRNGPTGRNTNDVDHKHFAIECKYRKVVPKLLKKGLEQAKLNDRTKKKTPVLFIKEKASPKDMVVMYASDFYNWFGVKINGNGVDGEEE